MSNISFDIPEDLDEALAKLGPDLSRTAKEAFLVDLYRRRAITLRQMGSALGLARLEVDAVLKRHEVSNGLSVEEFRSELEALRNLPQ